MSYIHITTYTTTPMPYTLSLHDALPISTLTWEVHDGQVDSYDGGYNDWTFARAERARQADAMEQRRQNLARKELAWLRRGADRKSTRLNSSHVAISYAVFCLKKKIK